MNTKYYIEDVVFSNRQPRLIRHREDALIERYDFNNKKWVQDDLMLQIYTGDIEVNSITEKEMKQIIAG